MEQDLNERIIAKKSIQYAFCRQVDQFGYSSEIPIEGTLFGLHLGLRSLIMLPASSSNRLFCSASGGVMWENRWESPGGNSVDGYESQNRQGIGPYARIIVNVNMASNGTTVAPGIGIYRSTANIFASGQGYSEILAGSRRSIAAQDVRFGLGLMVSERLRYKGNR